MEKSFLLFFKYLIIYSLCICISSCSDENIRSKDKLISKQKIDDGFYLYVTLYDKGGATVPFIYRYYLNKKISQNIVKTLSHGHPFL